MANPTTNFGWVMPTSSSLVTNLPADFNTFGQAVDTSMSELLGGTTGQVLSKTSNTNMDFTWVTPTDQTPLTTKGDLFTFTTVDARLAVGANGETLVADSAATTGLRYSATPSASNPILNSAMNIWQRGTSFSIPATSSAAYYLDRFQMATNANQACTLSRQATGDTTNLPFIQYCARVQRNSGQTGTGALSLAQTWESANSIPFAGKTVTFSFYARAGANFSGSFSATLVSGTGTDQNIFSGFTGSATVANPAITLTTTWQRFTTTGTVGATATQLATYVTWTPSGTAGVNDYYEITGWQVDVGSVALPFRTYAATIQGELAACQRYYFRYDPNASGTSASFSRFGFGSANSTSVARVQISNPVAMRIGAATLDYGSQITLFDGVTANAVSTLAIDTSTPLATTLVFTASSAGLTQYRPYWLYANSSTTAVVGLSAEL